MSSNDFDKNMRDISINVQKPIQTSLETKDDSDYSEDEGNGITDQNDPHFEWGVEGEQWEWCEYEGDEGDEGDEDDEDDEEDL